MAQNRSS
jgi:hypothetical protein